MINKSHLNLAALAYAPWEEGQSEDEIVGRWAEDNSTYKIKVPTQLRQQIIELQNALYRKMEKLQGLEQDREKEQRKLEEFLA